MRKLTIKIISILIITTIICLVISFTTSAPVTNDIYIDQLNGGNVEYVEMQIQQTYQNNSNNLKAMIITVATILIGFNIVSFAISRKK